MAKFFDPHYHVAASHFEDLHAEGGVPVSVSSRCWYFDGAAPCWPSLPAAALSPAVSRLPTPFISVHRSAGATTRASYGSLLTLSASYIGMSALQEVRPGPNNVRMPASRKQLSTVPLPASPCTEVARRPCHLTSDSPSMLQASVHLPCLINGSSCSLSWFTVSPLVSSTRTSSLTRTRPRMFCANQQRGDDASG